MGSTYIQLAKVLYSKLPTTGKQLPIFSHKLQGLDHQLQRLMANVLPLHQLGPSISDKIKTVVDYDLCQKGHIFMFICLYLQILTNIDQGRGD